jgi:hypothetical protein
MFSVASDRRIISRSRFYREIESNSFCLRSVYIHVWISKFERLDRIVCVCRWEYLSTIYSHFARNNWSAKTFFLDEIHTVFIKTSCNVRSVTMTRNDFIVEPLMNNFLMSLITAWLSQYKVTFFSTKIWIQVLSAHSIACISLRFMCINRIRLEKRTKNAWSRVIFSELDSRISSRVVKESASSDDSKRISSNWKNDSFENMKRDFLHERELLLEWLRSNFLINWSRDNFLIAWSRDNFLIAWSRDNFLIECELFLDWSRESFLVERELFFDWSRNIFLIACELFLDWLRDIFLELWRNVFLELWKNVFLEL